MAWTERGLATWCFISPAELLCPPPSSLSIHVHIPVLVGDLQLLTLEELDRTGGGWAAAENLWMTIRAGMYPSSATGMRLSAGEGLKRSDSRPNLNSEKRNMDTCTSQRGCWERQLRLTSSGPFHLCLLPHHIHVFFPLPEHLLVELSEYKSWALKSKCL